MALSLLDGTDGSLDLMVTFPSGTSGSSLRCVINSLEYRSTRTYQSAATLCDGQWEDELPGKRQDFIRITKLASKGAIISDTSVLMGATNASAVVFTAQTGCTKSGLFWPDTDSTNVGAGTVAMPGELNLRSKGSVATVWVTS
jgi:hypothetical protein